MYTIKMNYLLSETDKIHFTYKDNIILYWVYPFNSQLSISMTFLFNMPQLDIF